MKITEKLLTDNGYYLDNSLGYKMYVKDRVEFKKDMSNRIDADWTVHIDSTDMNTICQCDIATMEEYNHLIAYVLHEDAELLLGIVELKADLDNEEGQTKFEYIDLGLPSGTLWADRKNN